ncbi:MAG TPA: hypothetical protein VE684_18075 [Crenalkalicoccus sp.]|jgi:hypothetical protein|nr:hypothetical protein [Crenalkalicoccus sp.]
MAGADQAGGFLGPPGGVVPLAQPAGPALRSHLDLAAENDGLAPWCGPAALALAAGLSYEAACALLREVAPDWYPASGPVVTAYWRDLLAGLARHGIRHEAVEVPPRITLLDLLRGGLAAGWYLLRVTDHFLLLRSDGAGGGVVHDNRHTGEAPSGRLHGRRRVSHAARLLGGPVVR